MSNSLKIVGCYFLFLFALAGGEARATQADHDREWIFVVCVYHDPVMQPYLLRPIGEGVKAPTREACEAARRAVSEWTGASGEIYVVGRCERAEEPAKLPPCPQAPNR